MANFFEPRVLRRSRARWAISPFQAKEWLTRYGVTSEVCWHSVDVGAFERADAGTSTGPPSIVMLGTVYAVNGGEVRRLCRAVQALREESHPDLMLRLFTTQTAEQLASEGVPDPPWLDVASLDPDQIPSALAEARILFLGLSFEPRLRRLGQVAFPTKLAEYLAAGRPILVNAPEDATASTYVREHAAGVVVDQPDVQAVIEGLQLILEDRVFANTLGKRGRELARSNHDRSRMVPRFRERIDHPITHVNDVVLDRDGVSGL
jgi:glycosyltransferase involved in cell wall biosynthesis